MAQPEQKHHDASNLQYGIDILGRWCGAGKTAQWQRGRNAHGLPAPAGAACPAERIPQQCAVVSAQAVD